METLRIIPVWNVPYHFEFNKGTEKYWRALKAKYRPRLLKKMLEKIRLEIHLKKHYKKHGLRVWRLWARLRRAGGSKRGKMRDVATKHLRRRKRKRQRQCQRQRHRQR